MRNRRRHVEQEEQYMQRQRHGYPPNYLMGQGAQPLEMDKRRSMPSRGDSSRDEIRMKIMKETSLPTHRQQSQDMFNRSYDSSRMRDSQYMKNEYMSRQSSHPGYPSHYDYPIQKQYDMSPFNMGANSNRGPSERIPMGQEIQSSSGGIPPTMGSKYDYQFSNRERMMNDQMMNMNEYKQRMYQSQYQNEPSSIYLSRRYMMSVLLDRNPKYCGIKRVGREEKKLTYMKRLHIIKKLKNIYKCLRDSFDKEKEIMETELGKPQNLNELKMLAEAESGNIELASVVSELMQAVKSNAQPNQAFDPHMNEFDSVEEIEKFNLNKRSKRKNSDDSFYGSQSSFSGFKRKFPSSLEKPLNDTQGMAEGSNRLQFKRACKDKKKEYSMTLSKQDSFDEDFVPASEAPGKNINIRVKCKFVSLQYRTLNLKDQLD